MTDESEPHTAESAAQTVLRTEETRAKKQMAKKKKEAAQAARTQVSLAPFAPQLDMMNIGTKTGGRQSWVHYALYKLPLAGIFVNQMVMERINLFADIFIGVDDKGTKAPREPRPYVCMTIGPPGTGKNRVDRAILSLIVDDTQCLYDLSASAFASKEKALISVSGRTPGPGRYEITDSLAHYMHRVAKLRGPKIVFSRDLATAGNLKHADTLVSSMDGVFTTAQGSTVTIPWEDLFFFFTGNLCQDEIVAETRRVRAAAGQL